MSTTRPLRADAERNRARILAAAAEVFADRGLDVSLDEIAAHAGVGIGTVYRRFPDKDALIDALFEEKIDRAVELADAALEIEDPWEAFTTFMRGMCRMQAGDRGFKDALLARDRGRERVAGARERIAPRAMKLLTRAQEAGAVRLGPRPVRRADAEPLRQPDRRPHPRRRSRLLGARPDDHHRRHLREGPHHADAGRAARPRDVHRGDGQRPPPALLIAALT